MDTFTVYLFVRDRSDTQPPIAIERRLQAQQALRDELAALGVRATALPHEADLQVEITSVLGLTEEPGPTHSTHPTRATQLTHPTHTTHVTRATHVTQNDRVLIIRLLIGDEPVEFVCSDGIGRIPAERHAARRVLVWLNKLSGYRNRAGREAIGGLTVSLSTN